MARDPVLEEAFRTRLAIKRIAQMVGISHAAVSQWTRVPERHVWAVSKITGIPAAKLRPDIRYYQECAKEPAE